MNWYKEKGAEIIDISVKDWTDKSKKTKEEIKATTIKKIDLSIIILNKKDDIGLKEMNLEIDPDLTPKEEKKAVEYNEGIGAIMEQKKEIPKKTKEPKYFNFDDWLQFVRENDLRDLNKYEKFAKFYPQLPPDPNYYNDIKNSSFDYIVNDDIIRRRRR